MKCYSIYLEVRLTIAKTQGSFEYPQCSGCCDHINVTISQITNTFVPRKHSASGVDWPLSAQAVTSGQLGQGPSPARELAEVRSCLCLTSTYCSLTRRRLPGSVTTSHLLCTLGNGTSGHGSWNMPLVEEVS